ncbi:MAG: WD40 repeat domain-containing protein [Planctomycetes bacterium]|nr:WD40 repeat domain-containing protein [Planctomycetota bacterium]
MPSLRAVVLATLSAALVEGPASANEQTQQPRPDGEISIKPLTVIGEERLRHWGRARVLGFAAQKQAVVSISDDGTIRLWDTAQGVAVRNWAVEPRSANAAVSGDGRLLFIAADDAIQRHALTRDQPATKWNLPLPEFPILAADGDGKRVACRMLKNGAEQVAVLDATTGAELARYDCPAHRCQRVAINREGTLVAAAHGPLVSIWSFKSGKRLHLIPAHSDGINVALVYGLDFSPDGRRLATGGADRRVKVWDVEHATVETEAEMIATVASVSWHPEGKLLASAGGELVVWKPDGEGSEWIDATFSPKSVVFSADGEHLAAAIDHAVGVFDTRTGRSLDPARLMPKYTSLAFLPTSSQILAGNANGVLAIFDGKTGRRVVQWPGHVGEVLRVAVSPDGALAASAGADKSVIVWHLDTRKPRHTFQGIPIRKQALAFSADGRWFASVAWRGAVEVRDVRDGAVVSNLLAPNVRQRGGMAFNPGGTMLYTAGSQQTVFAWHLQSGQLGRGFGRPTGHDEVPLALSGNGRYLAAGDTWRGVEIHDLHKNQTVALKEEQPGLMFALAFTPDGDALASGAQDGTVRFWDPVTGAQRQSLRIGPPGGTVRQIAFSTDDRLLATVNGNGSVYVFEDLAP